jgi:hypothetical protein
MIAVYLVGPAYAWTNLKLTTLSSGKDQIYLDSPSHPPDEARMRGIFYLLEKMGHTTEVAEIKLSWKAFLDTTANGVPSWANNLALYNNIQSSFFEVKINSFYLHFVPFAY